MASVVTIFRRKNPAFFSIEAVFERIRNSWKGASVPTILELPDFGFSFGNLKFLHAFYIKNRSAIFHVTGDAHYVVFALDPKRTILTIHDCGFAYQTKGIKKWILKKLLLDWPVRYVHQITTISEKVKEEIILLTNCRASKIRVIPNPVSPHIYYSQAPVFRERPVFLFIGITPNKNLERVCEALMSIPSTLRIIGKLSEVQMSVLTRCNIQWSSVNGISHAEMADEYAAADAVLFPSLYEGFGLPIIESFQAGRPLLTSDLSPMKEIAGDAALLVDPTDVASIRRGIIAMMEDSQLRQHLVKQGLELVKKYQAEQIAVQYQQLYEQVDRASCVA